MVSVSELNRRIKETIEGSFGALWVKGEITGFTAASSGHWYFSLKDARAQVRCAMFRGRNSQIKWLPKNGDSVEVLCFPSIYEARGEFQLTIEDLRRAGLGALFEAFQALKEKLQAEGLFDPAQKRPLPRYPRRIAIVTSAGAAALRDVVTSFNRRAPHIALRLYPSLVQGPEAPTALIKALKLAEAEAWAELIVLCRGGGSMEDLWAFNDEALARTIRGCRLPVISGVGHETDFTIADFVADLRAPTPTAAAELASPTRVALIETLIAAQEKLKRRMTLELERRQRVLDTSQQGLSHRIERQLQDHAMTLDRLRARLLDPREAIKLKRATLATWALRLNRHHPKILWDANRQGLSTAIQRLRQPLEHRLKDQRLILKAHAQALLWLNPERVLERGYSLVFKDGLLVRDALDVASGESITVQLARGSLKATRD